MRHVFGLPYQILLWILRRALFIYLEHRSERRKRKFALALNAYMRSLNRPLTSEESKEFSSRWWAKGAWVEDLYAEVRIRELTLR